MTSLFTDAKATIDRSKLVFKQKKENKDHESIFVDRQVISGNIVNEKYLIIRKEKFIVLDLIFVEKESDVSFVQSFRYNNPGDICEMLTSQ